MMKLMHNFDVPNLEKLAVSDKVHRESYYTAHEMLRALSAQIDDEVNDKIQQWILPFIHPLLRWLV